MSDICSRHRSGVLGDGAGQEMKRGGHGDNRKDEGRNGRLKYH